MPSVNAFDPAFALANLRTAHEGISSLLSDKLLPDVARAPLQQAIQGIREATGAVVLQGGVHLSELVGGDG